MGFGIHFGSVALLPHAPEHTWRAGLSSRGPSTPDPEWMGCSSGAKLLRTEARPHRVPAFSGTLARDLPLSLQDKVLQGDQEGPGDWCADGVRASQGLRCRWPSSRSVASISFNIFFKKPP